MTYVKQLEDYEEAVMQKRLQEMPEEELDRLMKVRSVPTLQGGKNASFAEARISQPSYRPCWCCSIDPIAMRLDHRRLRRRALCGRSAAGASSRLRRRGKPPSFRRIQLICLCARKRLNCSSVVHAHQSSISIALVRISSLCNHMHYAFLWWQIRR